MSTEKNIVKPESLANAKFLAFYNKNKKKLPKKYRLNDCDYIVRRVASEIWKVTQKKLLEAEGGVVLSKIGYLAHWMSPVKKVRYSKIDAGVDHLNFFSGNYFYYTELFTKIFATSPIRGWALDRGACKGVKKGRFKELQAGMKYKLYWSAIKKMYSKKSNE